MVEGKLWDSVWALEPPETCRYLNKKGSRNLDGALLSLAQLLSAIIMETAMRRNSKSTQEYPQKVGFQF